MDKDASPPLIQAGAIDLRVLARVVKRRSGLIGSVTLIFLAASMNYLHMATKKYAVRMEIVSATPINRVAGGLSALSSLAGISVNGDGNPQFRLFLGTLRSPVAAEALISDQDLLRSLFSRDWSMRQNRWREPSSRLRTIVHNIEQFFGIYVIPWTPPNANRVFDYLQENLKIIQDEKSGVVTLEIDSARPAVVARLLIKLNDVIDDRMRRRDLAHASIDIQYLTNRLPRVTVEEYRRALIANLADQEKTRMLATAPLPYASAILGKPTVSSKPVHPSPVAVLALGIILGAMLGIGFAVWSYGREAGLPPE